MPQSSTTLAELNESQFQGNVAAFAEMNATLSNNRLIGFVGAGVSMPLMPSWTTLLEGLIEEASREGMINNEDKSELIAQCANDPLSVADSLEESFKRPIFRSKI